MPTQSITFNSQTFLYDSRMTAYQSVDGTQLMFTSTTAPDNVVEINLTVTLDDQQQPQLHPGYEVSFTLNRDDSITVWLNSELS
ncbi:hypothetical protein [Secundilactobacillus muriivasis]